MDRVGATGQGIVREAGNEGAGEGLRLAHRLGGLEELLNGRRSLARLAVPCWAVTVVGDEVFHGLDSVAISSFLEASLPCGLDVLSAVVRAGADEGSVEAGSVPVHDDLPERIVVRHVACALLELGDIDGELDMGLVGDSIVVDHPQPG